MLSKAIKDEIFRLPEQEKRLLIEEIWDSMEAIPAIYVNDLATRIHNRFQEFGGVDLEPMPRKPIEERRTEF